MADHTDQPPADLPNDPIPDGQGDKPEEAKPEGADTPPAKPEAKPNEKHEPEKMFTQADVDRIVRERLQREVKKGIREELKKLSGDGDDKDKPTVESIARERDTLLRENRIYKAADEVEAYVSDKNIKVRNMRGLLKFIRSDYQFDDDGKVANLKELIAEAKRDAPELFGVNAGSADGGAGNGYPVGADMNTLIRQAAGRA